MHKVGWPLFWGIYLLICISKICSIVTSTKLNLENYCVETTDTLLEQKGPKTNIGSLTVNYFAPFKETILFYKEPIPGPFKRLKVANFFFSKSVY